MGADLETKVADLAARSATREADKLGRLRGLSNDCGFTEFYRAFARVFGPGTRVVWFGTEAEHYDNGSMLRKCRAYPAHTWKPMKGKR